MKRFIEWLQEDVPANNASGGAVRGIGAVTGAPDGAPNAYVAGNVADSDQRNNVLKGFINAYHDAMHPTNKVKRG